MIFETFSDFWDSFSRFLRRVYQILFEIFLRFLRFFLDFWDYFSYKTFSLLLALRFRKGKKCIRQKEMIIRLVISIFIFTDMPSLSFECQNNQHKSNLGSCPWKLKSWKLRYHLLLKNVFFCIFHRIFTKPKIWKRFKQLLRMRGVSGCW